MDKKLSLVEHFGELRKHIIICLVAVIICGVFCFFYVDSILSILSKPVGNLVFLNRAYHRAFLHFLCYEVQAYTLKFFLLFLLQFYYQFLNYFDIMYCLNSKDSVDIERFSNGINMNAFLSSLISLKLYDVYDFSFSK